MDESFSLITLGGVAIEAAYEPEPGVTVQDFTIASLDIERSGNLAVHLGTYTETVVIEDEGRLHAVHVRHDPLDIFDPVGPDRFESEFGQVQFERDGAGTVTRMLVSSGRVRNLRFERVGW